MPIRWSCSTTANATFRQRLRSFTITGFTSSPLSCANEIGACEGAEMAHKVTLPPVWLDRALEDLSVDGYCVLPGVFSLEFLSRAREAMYATRERILAE